MWPWRVAYWGHRIGAGDWPQKRRVKISKGCGYLSWVLKVRFWRMNRSFPGRCYFWGTHLNKSKGYEEIRVFGETVSMKWCRIFFKIIFPRLWNWPSKKMWRQTVVTNSSRFADKDAADEAWLLRNCKQTACRPDQTCEQFYRTQNSL